MARAIRTTYAHLAGPRVTQGDKRYLLPDPTSLTTVPYGTKVPFVNCQDSSLKKYTSLNPDAWLGARFKMSNGETPAKEKEGTAAPPVATSDDENSASDAESTKSTSNADRTAVRTRAGRKIVPPSRMGY